jgi:hypothetical protein
MNRVRHLPTVALVVRNRRATVVSVTPAAHANTRRARNATARVTRIRLATRSNSARSSSVTINVCFFGRPVIGMALLDHTAIAIAMKFVSRTLAARGESVARPAWTV